MAHSEKYTKSQTSKVIRETERELENYENNVDTSRSDENYFFQDYANSKEVEDRLSERILEVMKGRKLQKNTKVTFSWVVSCPEELKQDINLQTKFFEAVNRFNEQRFGKENILLSGVHRDETNPHYHSLIIPVCKSRKNGLETISYASHSMGKKDSFRQYQVDLNKYIEDVMGMENLILNGKTKYGVDNLKVFKELSKAEQDLEKNKKDLKEVEKERINIENELLDLKVDYRNINDQRKKLYKEKEQLEKELKTIEENFDSEVSNLRNKAELKIKEIKSQQAKESAKLSKLKRTFERLKEWESRHPSADGKSLIEEVGRETGWDPRSIPVDTEKKRKDMQINI